MTRNSSTKCSSCIMITVSVSDSVVMICSRWSDGTQRTLKRRIISIKMKAKARNCILAFFVIPTNHFGNGCVFVWTVIYSLIGIPIFVLNQSHICGVAWTFCNRYTLLSNWYILANLCRNNRIHERIEISVYLNGGGFFADI